MKVHLWLFHMFALIPASAAFSGQASTFLTTVPNSAVILRSSTATLSTEVDGADSESSTSISQEKTENPPLKPGELENAKFECDDSVQFWRDFQKDSFNSVEENLQALSNVASDFSSLGADGLSYWLRHVGRSSYFTANALVGNAAFLLHERLVKGDTLGFTSALPFNMDGAVASRLLLEAALCYQQDYEQIRSNVYREPWDMKPDHRQSSPANVLTQTGRFVQEAIGTLGRRKRAEQKDKDIWMTKTTSATSDKLLSSKIYPDYYMNAFHFQTDGWMSSRSANVYETSTETLFLGRQDSMQRSSLKALMEFVNEESTQPKPRRPLRVLEVACGTGRFMTFVRDNLPLDTEYTAIDLSPFYLENARENDKYWCKTRLEQEGSSSNMTSIEPARLLQAKAESLPFEMESFDVVICVYLFHELPRSVRESVAAEMGRVVRPGGLVMLTDSIQKGDRPILDENLGNFERMNEPYYTDYCEDNLPAHFEKVGLVPKTKNMRSTTKSLSFRKES